MFKLLRYLPTFLFIRILNNRLFINRHPCIMRDHKIEKNKNKKVS